MCRCSCQKQHKSDSNLFHNWTDLPAEGMKICHWEENGPVKERLDRMNCGVSEKPQNKSAKGFGCGLFSNLKCSERWQEEGNLRKFSILRK